MVDTPLPQPVAVLMERIHTDIIILGGGIAGLWLLNRLRQAGYHAVLLERDQLGGAQTLASQGIIHGGMKYALSGILTAETEAIADMPDTWRACLDGSGELDLRGTEVLSDTQYMWSQDQLASRLTTFFASRFLRGRINALKRDDYPPVLADKSFHGSVYKLNDVVIDTVSLMARLKALAGPWCFQLDEHNSHIEIDAMRNVQGIAFTHHGQSYRLSAQRYILAAGSGNARLMEEMGIRSIEMQSRPLHMAMVKHSVTTPFFAHCVGTSARPIATITSHSMPDGDMLWYIGGDIAEEGVALDERVQIEHAQKRLHDILPWVSLPGAHWQTLRINRAEPKTSNLLKPDNAFAEASHNSIVCWPTKLTLAPNLARQVLEMLTHDGLQPEGMEQTLLPLPEAEVAPPFWHAAFQ